MDGSFGFLLLLVWYHSRTLHTYSAVAIFLSYYIHTAYVFMGQFVSVSTHSPTDVDERTKKK